VTDSFLATFGLYGGALVVGFVAGLFPLVSVEVFLFGVVALAKPTWQVLVVLAVLGAVGHQIAKTITYVIGARSLDAPKGRLKKLIDKTQRYLDKWQQSRWVVLLLSSIFGIPPLFAIGFVAKPMLKIDFWPFTLICLGCRIARYVFITLLAYGVF
jgi:membrane protein YqaA with SNARE-associated domain